MVCKEKGRGEKTQKKETPVQHASMLTRGIFDV